MPEFNEVDRKLLDALEGPDKIKLLLRSKGLENPVQGFAGQIGRWAEQVSMCLRGDRKYEDIRDALAEFLGVSRAQIDLWIDGVPAAGGDERAAV